MFRCSYGLFLIPRIRTGDKHVDEDDDDHVALVKQRLLRKREVDRAFKERKRLEPTLKGDSANDYVPAQSRSRK